VKSVFEGVIDPDVFLDRLCEVPGIGNWTAQYVAMRALGEPDAFPSGDIGLLNTVAPQVIGNWKNALKLGDLGEPTRQSMSGVALARPEHVTARHCC